MFAVLLASEKSSSVQFPFGVLLICLAVAVAVVLFIAIRRRSKRELPHYGSRLRTDEDPPSQLICSNCGKPLTRDAAFCSECGYAKTR